MSHSEVSTLRYTAATVEELMDITKEKLNSPRYEGFQVDSLIVSNAMFGARGWFEAVLTMKAGDSDL